MGHQSAKRRVHVVGGGLARHRRDDEARQPVDGSNVPAVGELAVRHLEELGGRDERGVAPGVLAGDERNRKVLELESHQNTQRVTVTVAEGWR